MDGEANKELARYLSKALGIPRSQVEVAQGHRSRRKVVSISGGGKELTAEQVLETLRREADG